jgi:hypothetical protein
MLKFRLAIKKKQIFELPKSFSKRRANQSPSAFASRGLGVKADGM